MPHAWFEQIADGGLLEVPLRLDNGGRQVIAVLEKTRRGFRSIRVVCDGFMPLRGAADDGGWMPRRDPGPNVTDFTRDKPECFLQLNGAAHATLSGPAKRRQAATALGRPRKVHLGLRAEPSALGLYLSLTLPRGRRVTSFPTSVGAISRDGRSLALVETHPEQSGVDVMMAYGGAEAEELLLGRVRRWADRGRPGESDVRIAVTYADDRPRLTLRWP